MRGSRAKLHLRNNAKAIRKLKKLTGIPTDPDTLAFVAGTMFWFRPQALAGLQGHLGAADFEPEPLPVDGTMQHAMEPFFGAVAAYSGYSIQAIETLHCCGPNARRDVLTFRREIIRPIEVDPGKKLCLFASYSPDGTVRQHAISYCQRLRELGFRVVMIVATDTKDLKLIDPGPQACDALIVRENAGFDFASWATALKIEPRLWTCSSLFFANDSVYSSSPNLSETIERIEGIPADFVGLTDSIELQPHFQSFFFVLQNRALQHPKVQEFWNSVRVLSTKHEVIANYEVFMRRLFEAAGLRCRALFPASLWNERRNPAHFRWRELIECGFPFVKVELLRDNPAGVDLSGWDRFLSSRGFDVGLIKRHLHRVCPKAPALKEIIRAGSHRT